MNIKAELHYQRRSDGRHTFAVGRVTTDHSSSSYGSPVFIAESTYRHGDTILVDVIYGPGDVPEGAYLMAVSPVDNAELAQVAMWQVHRTGSS